MRRSWHSIVPSHKDRTRHVNFTVKRIAGEVQHASGVQQYLFTDKQGHALQVLWREGGRADCGLSLPAVESVEVMHVDGEKTMLIPQHGILTLGISEEPLMLRYRSMEKWLSRTLSTPMLAVDPAQPLSILKGETRTVLLTGPGLKAGELVAAVPHRWTASFEQRGEAVALTIRAPRETGARTGT